MTIGGSSATDKSLLDAAMDAGLGTKSYVFTVVADPLFGKSGEFITALACVDVTSPDGQKLLTGIESRVGDFGATVLRHDITSYRTGALREDMVISLNYPAIIVMQGDQPERLLIDKYLLKAMGTLYADKDPADATPEDKKKPATRFTFMFRR